MSTCKFFFPTYKWFHNCCAEQQQLSAFPAWFEPRSSQKSGFLGLTACKYDAAGVQRNSCCWWFLSCPLESSSSVMQAMAPLELEHNSPFKWLLSSKAHASTSSVLGLPHYTGTGCSFIPFAKSSSSSAYCSHSKYSWKQTPSGWVSVSDDLNSVLFCTLSWPSPSPAASSVVSRMSENVLACQCNQSLSYCIFLFSSVEITDDHT